MRFAVWTFPCFSSLIALHLLRGLCLSPQRLSFGCCCFTRAGRIVVHFFTSMNTTTSLANLEATVATYGPTELGGIAVLVLAGAISCAAVLPVLVVSCHGSSSNAANMWGRSR
ncbi:hypothetical protein C8Q79DRAFT_669261 [Trametes meyenii]|nr:hypothetical protein C8Q79DRAFT_669261 [Trametes meyenii]